MSDEIEKEEMIDEIESLRDKVENLDSQVFNLEIANKKLREELEIHEVVKTKLMNPAVDIVWEYEEKIKKLQFQLDCMSTDGTLNEKISELEKENSDLKESLDMKSKELELERNRFKIDSDLNKKLLDQSHQRIKELEPYKLALKILEGVLNRIN
jgi:exonuclease VII large subunit